MRRNSKQEADQFEEALQQAAQGRAVSEPEAGLVEVARMATALSAQPPPPPYGLAPGRQRFLAEAAGLRAGKGRTKAARLGSPVFRLAAAMLAVILVVGAIAGTGQVAADSLPGSPLYGVKLTVERTRLTLTKSPEAQASLNLELAEVRLTEVTMLVTQGQDVDQATVTRTTEQLDAALQAANTLEESEASHWREELAVTLQQRQRTMAAAAGDEPAPQIQLILREMERVRQEAHAGAGEPEGEQNRLRHGTPPPEPSGMPQATPRNTDRPGDGHQPGPGAEPEPSVSLTRTPTVAPSGTPTGTPSGTPTDKPGGTPTDTPGGTPTDTPGGGPTDRPGSTATDAPGGTPAVTPRGTEPNPTQTPGPGPSQTPEPGPTQPPGPGPGPSEPPGDGPGDGDPPPGDGGDKGPGP